MEWVRKLSKSISLPTSFLKERTRGMSASIRAEVPNALCDRVKGASPAPTPSSASATSPLIPIRGVAFSEYDTSKTTSSCDLPIPEQGQISPFTFSTRFAFTTSSSKNYLNQFPICLTAHGSCLAFQGRDLPFWKSWIGSLRLKKLKNAELVLFC